MRLALIAVVALLAGCAGRSMRHVAPTNVRPAARVMVEGIYYWTDTVHIATGQVVEWVNADIIDHTVSFEGQGHRLSGKLKAKGSYSVRFDNPGIYKYYCDPHPSMRAVVVVK